MNTFTSAAAIGDRIKFRVTTRDGTETVTRVVIGHTPNGGYEVRYHGYDSFIVRANEVIAIYWPDLATDTARKAADAVS